MKIKPGVIMPNQMEMRIVHIVAEGIWNNHGQELVVTSGMEGEHSAGSLHYYGYAVDYRTRYFTPAEKRSVASALQSRLNAVAGFGKYYVLPERTHIHVHYNLNSKENNK